MQFFEFELHLIMLSLSLTMLHSLLLLSVAGTTEPSISPSPEPRSPHHLGNEYTIDCQFCEQQCNKYAGSLRRLNLTWFNLRKCGCHHGYQLEPNGRSCSGKCLVLKLVCIV